MGYTFTIEAALRKAETHLGTYFNPKILGFELNQTGEIFQIRHYKKASQTGGIKGFRQKPT